MALRVKVLRTKAAKAEQKEEMKHKLNPVRISAFDEMLHNVYTTRRPKPSDYDVRKDLVRVFNEIAKELYGNSNAPVVVEFGSFSMDIFDAKSDLDLSVNFGNGSVQLPRDKRIQTLRKFAKKFYALQRSGHVTRVLPITTAKVPILKAVDCGTGVECDISIENWDGISKSRIINLISLIDDRFPKLSFLMKAWAKAHNINSSKDKTLNSLSLVLLVAFHLQTRNPPILPPFSALLEDGSDPESVKKLCRNFTGYGGGNKETLGELFVSLLVKLSAVEILWPKGLCASAYEGSWASKTWDTKVGCISVEDFTDRSQNVARAVGVSEAKTIYKCIKLSVRHLSAFMDSQIEGSRLIELLFASNAPPTAAGTGIPHTAGMASRKGKKGKGKGKKRLPIMSNSVLEKGPRPVDSLGGTTIGIGAPAGAEQHTKPILSNSVLGKRPLPVDSCGGTSTGSWTGAPAEGEQQTRPTLSNSVLEKTPRPLDNWGGTSTGRWTRAPAGAEQQTRPTLSNSVLEKRPRPVDNWGGTSTSSWNRAPAEAEQQTRTYLAGSWGQAPTGIKQHQPITGWGVTQQPHPGAWDGRAVQSGPTWGAPIQASAWGLNADVQKASAWGRNADVQQASAWGRNADVQQASAWGRNADVQRATWVRNAGIHVASASSNVSLQLRNQAPAAPNYPNGHPSSSVPLLQQSFTGSNLWVPPSKRRR